MKIPTTKKPYVIFLSGPTGSGKTALSLIISERIPVEIINADVGQFYEPLSVGTAKPDWKNQKIPHHLFDIVSEPVDFNVVKYRELLREKIKEVWSRNKIPLIVGGSLFYLKSVFFPPQKIEELSKKSDVVHKISEEDLWKKLNEIDPERAEKIHQNDTYRIKRALEIWFKTGRKPSELKATFQADFDFLFIFLSPERELLFDKINKRTVEMIKDGWIDEVKQLPKKLWRPFLDKKGLIGYSEIFSWIEQGEKEEEFPELVATIQKETRLYAKRQLTFWNSFRKNLEKECSQTLHICRTITMHSIDDCETKKVVSCLEDDLYKKEKGAQK